MKDLHKGFQDLLESLSPSPSVIDLFKLILEEQYKNSNTTKQKRIENLNSELEKLKGRKEKLLDTLLDEVITKDTYEAHSRKIENEIGEKESAMRNLGNFQTELTKYVNFGTLILTNFKDLFEHSPISVKNQLLSSILAEKLEFKDNKYRTPSFKEGFNYIFQNINKLKGKEIKKGDSFSTISSKVPGAGLEPARP